MASSKTSSPVQIRCKGILFDMDGILISSIGSVERSWTRWALLRGVDPARAISIAHGCRSIDSVAILRPDLDAETENGVVEGFEIEDTDGVAVLPGVFGLLASLPRDRWTVVTSATDPLARVRMAAGNIPVPQRIVTAESVSEGKPHPAPYLAGAALLGLAPKDCVVFEDAASWNQGRPGRRLHGDRDHLFAFHRIPRSGALSDRGPDRGGGDDARRRRGRGAALHGAGVVGKLRFSNRHSLRG